MRTLGTRLGVIQRSKGQSAVSISSYGHTGVSLNSQAPAVSTPPGSIVHHAVYLPTGADQRFKDPDALWNEVEKVEKRRDSVVARRLDISLPRELPIVAMLEVLDLIAQRFLSFGVPVQVDLHITRASDGGKNPHCHFFIAERRLIGGAFESRKCSDVIQTFRAGFGRPFRARLAEIINIVGFKYGHVESLVTAKPLPRDGLTEPRLRRRVFKNENSPAKQALLAFRARRASATSNSTVVEPVSPAQTFEPIYNTPHELKPLMATQTRQSDGIKSPQLADLPTNQRQVITALFFFDDDDEQDAETIEQARTDHVKNNDRDDDPNPSAGEREPLDSSDRDDDPDHYPSSEEPDYMPADSDEEPDDEEMDYGPDY